MVGLMLSTVGMRSRGGVERFSFGFESAQAGVSFIALTTGLFGVAEVFSVMAEKEEPRGLVARKVSRALSQPGRNQTLYGTHGTWLRFRFSHRSTARACCNHGSFCVLWPGTKDFQTSR